MRRLVVAIFTLAAPACATGPEEPPATLLVKFSQLPTDADVAALEAVGGSVQHRINVARSVSMRAETGLTDGYAVVPGVRAVGTLGADEDPDVSVFITTDGAPTPDDAQFVRASGARSAHIVEGEGTISAVMPLSRVDELDARARIMSVEISLGRFQTHGDAALSAASLRGTDLRSVFITYRPGAPASRGAEVRGLGARSAHDVPEERTIAAVMPRSALDGLRRIPWVERIDVSDAEPLRVMTDLITWGMDSVRATSVHLAPGYRGSGVRVGVLDTRIQCTHGDLRERVAGGYDFVDSSSDFCGGGYYYGFPAHGTAVAGIIAGSRNGSGVLGVAPEAALYSLRVCDDAGECQAANIWPALLWARKAGVQVVNLSLGNCGGALDWRIADGLRRLQESKIVVVASAGNGTQSGCSEGAPVSSIASAAGVIAVAHWLRDGTQNQSFQYGPEIDLAAPAQVETADPASGVNGNLRQGTSFAAPHVTGAVALLLQAGFAGPDLVLRRLAETSLDRGAPGRDDRWGSGTLDVQRAAVARPFIADFGGSGVVTAAGSRTLTANIVNGAPPIAVTWTVSYSDPAVHASYAVTGGVSHDVPVPAGRYTITVRAMPREPVYGRTGAASVIELPVCTTDGGSGEIMARPITADAPGLRTTAGAGAC